MKIEITPNTNPIDQAAALTPVDKSYGSGGGGTTQIVVGPNNPVVFEEEGTGPVPVTLASTETKTGLCPTPITLLGNRKLIVILTISNIAVVTVPDNSYQPYFNTTFEIEGLTHSGGTPAVLPFPCSFLRTGATLTFVGTVMPTDAGLATITCKAISTGSKWSQVKWPPITGLNNHVITIPPNPPITLVHAPDPLILAQDPDVLTGFTFGITIRAIEFDAEG